MRFRLLALLLAAGCSGAPDPDVQSPDPHARFLGALELPESGGTAESVRTLVALLNDKTPLVRSGAVTALGVIGRPEFAQHLIPMATDPQEDPLVRSDAIATLARLKNPEAVPPLLEILKGEPEMGLRRDAAKALVSFGRRKEILEGLLGALEVKDPAVAYRAQLSLQELTETTDAGRSKAEWKAYLDQNP